MSISRQGRPCVRSYSITHPPGRVTIPTQPGWDYLVFATAGLFTALTESEGWTIPAHRALCVPDGTQMRIETPRRCAIRCLYIDRRQRIFGSDVRVITMAPLTRELMSHAVASAPMYLHDPVAKAMITLLADRLACEPDAPLQLPLPSDPAARRVADTIRCRPFLGLTEGLEHAHAHRRTVERRFKTETGLSLGQWRRRARILASVAMLSEGDSVTQAAMAVGYATPSSFVAAFRAELGSAPTEFMRR